jgi:ABC-type enterochelin transport system permease subunit
MKQFIKSLRESKGLSILWAVFAIFFSRVLFWLVDSQEMELSDLISIPILGAMVGLCVWSFSNFVYGNK